MWHVQIIMHHYSCNEQSISVREFVLLLFIPFRPFLGPLCILFWIQHIIDGDNDISCLLQYPFVIILLVLSVHFQYLLLFLLWLLLIVVSIISFYSSHSVSFFILLSFIVILSYSIQCSSNQDYVKVTKITKDRANPESFEIVSGSSVLFSSPPFSNNQQYMYEICLNTSSNHIFTLVMGDSSGWWYAGA